MVVEETPKVVESVLDDDNLTKIQEDYASSMLFRLEVPGPS